MQPKLFETHKQQYQELEYRLLSYSGLSVPDEIKSVNVPIWQDSWMHEVICGKENRHIVLLHGYGGTALTFVRVFKELSKQYTVHALDLLGMGLSHRKQFNTEWTKEEVVGYYIDSIEEWRKEKGIQKMAMVGHSYGGYIASCYSYKYMERIQRLCLISPAGTKYGNDQTNEQDYQRIYDQSSCFRKIIFSLMRKIVRCQPTPSGAMNCCCLGSFFMNKALTGRLHLQDKQKQDWMQYMKKLSKLKPNSQLSFWKLFYLPSMSASQSTYSMFATKPAPFKIDFYYGDSDWMQRQTAYGMTKIKINRVSFTMISDSGHQILFDNPSQMVSYLL